MNHVWNGRNIRINEIHEKKTMKEWKKYRTCIYTIVKNDEILYFILLQTK